ncbi:transcriptional regulator family: Fungal Specific TF [Penicillium macrosclerotiorum]|uniref:transcriptional regulator family: Fungal Specific TF n=1 Tax=Penicillium macrosclerotiorum TaxID=303699 RepID=UPI0025499420|nr:transcriptional regulator family: Fungal Specific TF [Penicillium macrosclerotiorum]KAJ5698580.1 transcriptional regulator family: Fungal Specific TF [Penicillium macrosclerotiorum]
MENKQIGEANPPSLGIISNTIIQRTLIKPQERDPYDPNVTFEEYAFFAEKTRTEEMASEPPALNLRQALGDVNIRGRFARPSAHAFRAICDFLCEKEEQESYNSRLEITDEEWANASRSFRSSSWVACFFLITTDILGPYSTGFTMGTLGWGPGE